MSDNSPTAAVVAVDAGGTNTRVVVAGLDGTIHGRAVGPGANQYSSDSDPATVLGSLAAAALDDASIAASAIRGTFIASAGGLASDTNTQRSVIARLKSIGITAPMVAAGDISVVVPGATDAADGTALAVGTGSIAAAVRDHEITRVVGGHGWRFGDEGSGVWMGTEAVRHAFAVFDGAAERDALFDAVVAWAGLTVESTPSIGSDRGESATFTGFVYQSGPIAVGQLAPTVSQLSSDTPSARAIADRAVSHLVDLAALTKPDGAPIALAGSVATGDHPVGRQLRAALRTTWPESDILAATDTLLGAVREALRRVVG